MTLKTTIEGHVSSVFMDTNHFAETVTRQIGGKAGLTEAQTVIAMSEGHNASYERGRETVHDLVMTLASSETVTRDDSYLVNGERYTVVSVGRSELGARPVKLKRVDGDRTEARVTRNLKS